MRPLVGWVLDGASYRGSGAGRTTLGEPAWGPAAFLRDLELRLALPAVDGNPSLRVQQWARRIDATIDARPFLARSFAADRIGTASTLLAWRDALVDAGWSGRGIASGGPRLEALAAIEAALPDEPLPSGTVDRMVRVEAELERQPPRTVLRPPYDTLTLVEPRAAWSSRWRRIFVLLEASGTAIVQHAGLGERKSEDTDLGRLQGMLNGEADASRPLRGDGSLLIVRGETSSELADFTAAFLAKHGGGALVVRCADLAPLERALHRSALPRQGHAGQSKWRPAMQVLPLAIELAFEPRDPYRALELLTLGVGPFRGMLGRSLAKAVARQPGIGGQEWIRQRERAATVMRDTHARNLHEREGKSEIEAAALADTWIASRLAQLTEWLETPGAPADGAPRERVLAIAERVRSWLESRLGAREGELFTTAYAHAERFRDAVAKDPRASLTQEEARRLLDHVASGADRRGLSVEEAGRIPHVADPSGLLAPADTIVVWGCVAGAGARLSPSPWNATERAALASSGVELQDETALLRIEADAWRRIALAARARLLFVVPSALDGKRTADHPVLDEIAARLRLGEEGAELIVRQARGILDAGGLGLVDVVDLPAQSLPEPRAAWTVSPGLLAPADETRGSAATSHEKLASCPLAWVLEQRARLRSGAIAKVASGPLLYGTIGHRLVEELHCEAAFDLDLPAFMVRALAQLEHLIATEGASLLLHGAENERVQLTQQIVRAMRELHRYLRAAGFRIAAVEEAVRVASTSGRLEGRLDLRLVREDGTAAVLDLKWGASSYRKLLEEGRAVQLAAYARAVAGEDPDVLPPAGYFAIAAARPLSADERMRVPHLIKGPSLDQTWEHVEATTKAVLDLHAKGTVLVLATRRALPLLDALGVAPEHQSDHYAPNADQACKYCTYDGLCGRAWESIA